MSGELLLTKLFAPSLRSMFVPRPRLIQQINQGVAVGCRLTLVSAPAGFGKTTLVTDWLSQYMGNHGQAPVNEGPDATWLALDEGDNHLSRFLTYLSAALQKLDGTVGDAAAIMLQSPQPPPMEAVLISLLNDLVGMVGSGRPEYPYVLVLDDYHQITAQEVHHAVSFLLENIPAHLHLLLITRSDPPLPLARLRVRGQMNEIRQADLQFTVGEAARFLNDVMGLSLSTSQVESLETRTEGWIAGLQLAALSMRQQDDVGGFVEAFSGSHRFVVDYLVEEVIQILPVNLRQFILQTSLLDRLSGALCEAVTGQDNGQESLEKLEASNLFLIPLDDERTWFRYHHLFAEVMASRLHQTAPEQILELHLRAAEWFRENSFFAEAIQHALAGDDYQLAAEIVESQVLSLLKEGRLATLLDWLKKLPPETVQESPRLSIALAWVYLLIGQLEPIEGCLLAAERKLDDFENADYLRGEIAAIHSYFAAMMGQADQAIDQAQRALALLDQENFTVRSVVTFVLGGVYFMRQDIPRALEAMEETSHLGEQAGNIHVAVSALSSAGDLYRRLGDFAASERAFDRAIQLGSGRSGKPLPISASAYSGLAALRLSQRDLVGARDNALIGLELGKILVNAESQVRCYLTLAQVEFLEDHTAEALEALEKAKNLAATHQLTPGLEEQIAACEKTITATTPRTPEAAGLDPLSDQELQVLRLVAAGLSNREVAEEMYLSINTVKWHLKHIYEKLDVHSRVAAVTCAQELGLF